MNNIATEYNFKVSSTSFKEGELIPDSFAYNGGGCRGQNLSPELEWAGAPSETKSFAITCFDPDAPTGHGWWHWTVVNIPNNVNKIEEGASNKGKLPRGALEIMTDFQEKGYGGPCPPRGKAHRYVFTVYALNTENIAADPMETAETLKKELDKKALAKASLTVKYARH